MAAIILLNEDDVEWRWLQMFQKPEAITVEDILEVTSDRGRGVGHLLSCLDDEECFSGIFQRVVVILLDSKVKQCLPIEITSTDLFESLSDGRLANVYQGCSEEVVRGNITDRFIPLLRACIGGNPYTPCKIHPSIARAMIAYTEFFIGNLVEALNSAGFALNEQMTDHFEDELFSNSITGIRSVVEVEKIIAEIVLQEARLMKQSYEE